jgi:MMP endo-(1,4)-3-O-methyl-alpha-D-mannosidase
VERTTWTAAAVVLAADALAGTGPAAGLFADPAALDRPAVPDRPAGLPVSGPGG